MQPLNIPTFPLHGQSLIEASAGTGKTYTIAELYNRLILGHGRGSEMGGLDKKLGCDAVLVVTFTKAATEELRGRLRARLSQTFNDVLRLENGIDCQDKALAQYLADLGLDSVADAADLQQLQQWLKANLALMDEASIFTIHGFCQRILQRYAFDTGVMFSADMTTDSDHYLQQACEDVWRQVAYGLNSEQSAALLNMYSAPEDLFEQVRSRINKPDVEILPWIPAKSFDELWSRFAEAFERVSIEIAQTSEEAINTWLIESDVDKRSYATRFIPSWTAKNFAHFKGKVSLDLPDCINRFSAAFIQEKSKSGSYPEHPLFQAVETMLQAAEPIQNLFKLGWLEQIKQRFWELLERSGALTPDDLMRLLNQALQGSQGESLATQIRELYPVAMIDEFQDTDAAQYDIFNRIYPNEPEASHGLIMIGDPKQAIYAFRGADIFTYIKAKQALPDERVFTLDTNYRSHTNLVSGVNQLFEKNANPFLYNQDIPFHPVKAAGQHDQQAFSINGQPQAPLQLWHDGVEYNRPKARRAVAEQCAQKIYELIHGQAKLGEKDVQAGDIVVLVRSRKQAAWVREALQHKGISSVFLTHDSVFKTQDAVDLFRWLYAVAHPNDERALRTALASAIQNQTPEQLAQYLTDEQAWEIALEQQRIYYDLWRSRGVMAAIMHWLETDDLALRLRQQPEGERRLTNLMHLGDLLQGASRKLQGHEALLRWLGEHVFDDTHSGDEAQLRLESDANLVSITTIHRSKGLQYPLVFLPYLWDDSNKLHNQADIVYYDEERKQVVLHLAAEKDEKALAEKANTAENLRLLYVALTRAVQGCFIWLAEALSRNKPVAFESGLGYLLELSNNPREIIEKDSKGKDKIIPRISWPNLAQRFADSPMHIGMLPDWSAPNTADKGQASLELAPAIEAQKIQPKPYDGWRVSSYSQLVARTPDAENSPETLVQLHQDEQAISAQSDWQQSAEQEVAIEFNPDDIAFTFAKGPQAGNALHDILEHWDFNDAQQLAEVCEKKLEYYGLELEESQLPLLANWLQNFVNTPLFNSYDERFNLAQLSANQRLNEMEFHLPVAHLKTSQLEQLLGESGRFVFYPLSGFLKGFIDLIFEHNGRYYVADYKSNFLGTQVSEYLGEGLQQAMLEHAYDLQAWIYTLALDAVLKQRLSNYDPAKHLGGVYYFFLRGMHLGASAPVITDAQGQQQAPGVYYQAVNLAELEKWREVFFGTDSEVSNKEASA